MVFEFLNSTRPYSRVRREGSGRSSPADREDGAASMDSDGIEYSPDLLVRLARRDHSSLGFPGVLDRLQSAQDVEGVGNRVGDCGPPPEQVRWQQFRYH